MLRESILLRFAIARFAACAVSLSSSHSLSCPCTAITLPRSLWRPCCISPFTRHASTLRLVTRPIATSRRTTHFLKVPHNLFASLCHLRALCRSRPSITFPPYFTSVHNRALFLFCIARLALAPRPLHRLLHVHLLPCARTICPSCCND